MEKYHKSITIKGLHNIFKPDWESILDRIYKKIIYPSLICYGIVSNTEKSSKSDIYGQLSKGITFRFHNNIDQSHHNKIVRLEKLHFERIFDNYLEIRDLERSDFYHLEKNQGFNMDILIYPLIAKNKKKGLLLVDFDKSNQELLNNIITDLYKIIEDHKNI